MSLLKSKHYYVFSLLAIAVITFSFNNILSEDPDVIIEQIPLEGNNIHTWVYNTGIFNQDFRTSNTPGFEWPKGQNKFAVFTTGLSIAAFVNGELREAMASYKGELAPGYVIDSSGHPRARTDIRFKMYNVKRTDNWINNPQWLNWGLMVPYGAPFVDVNHDGIYQPLIDTPGIRNAEQTIFACLTDGFPEEHKIGEGFGGGTPPLYAELHFTAWAYNIDGLKDVQFLRWVVINRNTYAWNKTYFAIVCDPDLGWADDDYIGCDSTRNLGYCYNGDNEDDSSQVSWAYGVNPPAVGFDLLRGAVNKNVNPNLVYEMTSGTYFGKSSYGVVCESDPNGEAVPAYQYMRGFKKDGTPWVIPNTNPPQTTKYCYSGDPETQLGWTESKGRVKNCGSLYGETVMFNPVGDRRFLISSGADNFTVNPGDTQIIMIAQLIARGSSHVNSVTKLKQLSDFVQAFVDNGFVIGVNPVSNEIPNEFVLYQNYPNPFNPVTKIKFSLPLPSKGGAKEVKLLVYDVLGREVGNLIPPLWGGKEGLSPGTFEVIWDASAYSSGVYFYKLQSGENTITKKMILLK